jgi:hypothetical protein
VNPEAARAAVVVATVAKAKNTTSPSLCTVLDRDAKRLAEKTTDVILWDKLLGQPAKKGPVPDFILIPAERQLLMRTIGRILQVCDFSGLKSSK